MAIDFVSRLPARLGADRLQGRLRPRGAVVPEGRRPPGERAGTATSTTPTSEFFSDFGDYDVSIDVPAALRGKVGATGRARRGARDLDRAACCTASSRRASTTSRGRPTRPSSSSSDTFREAGIGDADAHPAAPARARSAGGAPLPRAAKAALSGLRPRARAVPVRDADDRRSAVGRPRRRRHGVPDADHRRHAAGARPRASSAPSRSRSTRPATSSSTGCSRTTSSRRRGSTRASTPT